MTEQAEKIQAGIQKWGIGLVQLENSKGPYYRLNPERWEVAFVLQGYQYRDYATAARVITRWTSSQLVNFERVPGKLFTPVESREPLPNGRFMRYEWQPLAVDLDGVTGLIEGRRSAYRSAEYPHINGSDLAKKFVVVRECWSDGKPSYALWLTKGRYKGRVALLTGPEESGILNGRDVACRAAILQEDHDYAAQEVVLYKGSDF